LTSKIKIFEEKEEEQQQSEQTTSALSPVIAQINKNYLKSVFSIKVNEN